MRIGGRRMEEARVFDRDAGEHEHLGYSFTVFWHDDLGWCWCLDENSPVNGFGSSTAAFEDAEVSIQEQFGD